MGVFFEPPFFHHDSSARGGLDCDWDMGRGCDGGRGGEAELAARLLLAEEARLLGPEVAEGLFRSLEKGERKRESDVVFLPAREAVDDEEGRGARGEVKTRGEKVAGEGDSAFTFGDRIRGRGHDSIPFDQRHEFTSMHALHTQALDLTLAQT